MSAELEILTFDLGPKRFGVRSTHVQEVLRAVALSHISQSPAALEGVLNLRGRIVPVLDARKLLGLGAKALHHADHLLVLQADAYRVAIRVDRAIGLMRLSADADGSSNTGDKPLIEFVAKTSEGIVDVIDPARLLSESEAESLVRIIETSAATEINR